jgi:hypothetical protein
LSVTGTLTYINTTTETVSGIEVVAGNLVANSGTASSSTSTGALVVIGGAGISGAVNSGLGLFDGANRAVATTTGAGNLTITGNSISLTATGPGAVNVGSSTSIPTIATDQYGRVVSLTSNAISIAYTLNGTSGTTSVTNGSTLSLAGTYGVTVTVGTEYANIATPQDLRTTASPSFAGLYSANLSTGNAVISGGSITNTPISGSTGYFTTEQATNFSTANAMITGGTISGVSGGFSTLVTTNFSTANAVITGGHIDGTPVGLYTPSTGAFSTLSATGLATLTGGLSVTNPATFNGNLVAASGTASVSTTTGALVVTGGMGVTGNINVGNTSALHQITGNLLLGSGTAISGALTTLEVNQNTDTPQTSTSVVHVSAKSGQIGKISLDSFGTATPSLMIVRTSSGTSTTPSAVVSGQAIGGFIARGYGSTGYLLNPIGQSNGLVVVTTQNYTDTAQGSQLNLNATPLNSNVATTIMTLNGGGNVTIPASISSTNTSTGALVVVGGVGIGGALNVGTTITASGNIVAASGTSSASTTTGALVVTGGVGVSGSIYAGSLQNTPIGSTTASTAVFTTVSTAGLQAQAIGNVTPGTGAFTTLTTSGTAIHNGNIVAASGTASTSTTTGALVAVGGAGISGNVIAGGQVQAANGLYSTGSFNGGYSDGIIVDYASTNGRISVGSSDSLTFYSGGLAGTQTAQLSSTGVLTVAGNIVASSGTGSTTTTTGALVVVGGAGVSGNINVGGNATVSGASSFNTSQTAGYDHIVKGVNDSTLLWARPATAYDQVLIGNSATVSTLVRGAKLQINSSDSILLPVGTNAQRPSSAGGTDTAGMIRFSTTQNAVEWFNGTSWFSPTTAFTVIADQQFAGTGSQTTFTLNTSQTTASCIVSINGVVQIPTLAYSVSGTTLTFTEAPASTDVIDVRMLTTTVTVTSLSDSTGYNSVLVGSTGVQITTGTSAANVVASYTTTGAYVNGTPNVTVATSGTSTVDTFATNTYSSAEYLVTATISGTSIRQIAKVLVVTDGTNAYVTPYGITSTAGNTLVTFGGTVSSGNVNFQATTTNNNTILRMNKVYQAI